ncbi:MAG: 50S ribosomal protein L6 [Deltaproteobacteria bacterium]|nr:50S ribosomal protein L6 [Deltaproteobacteria bacterium]
MSRIGKAPIPIPDKVKVKYEDTILNVDGPKGSLNLDLRELVDLDITDSVIQVKAVGAERKLKAMHGLFRSLINNMVIGVTNGFTKSLEIVGVGYRAEADKQNLTLNVGYSNPKVLPIPEGLTIEVEKNTLIHVRGIDKQQVGEMAAKIRRVRKPEPYRGKGIRYMGELIRRKVGKAGSK